MKKLLSLLLAAMLLLGCLPAMAETAEFPKLDGILAKNYWGGWFGVSGLDAFP